MRRSIFIGVVCGLICGIGAFWLLTWLWPRPEPGSLVRVRGTDRYVGRGDAGAVPSTMPASRWPYLDARVAEVKGKLTLAQLADVVRKATGMAVELEPRTIEAAGVELTGTVDVDLRDVTVRRLLAIVLDEFGGGTVMIDYRAGHDGITISTAEDLDRRQVIKVYDVADILNTARKVHDADLSKAMEGPPTQGGSSRSGRAARGGGGAGGGWGGNGPESLSQEFLSLVREMVDPEVWVDHGGRQHIRIFGGVLLVNADERTHESLADFLLNLRLATVPGAGAASPADAPGEEVLEFSAPSVSPRAYLENRIPEVRGTFMLEQVAGVVRDATRANVVVEQRVLEAAGIAPSASVRLDMRDATVRQVLAAALASLSGEQELAYQAGEGLIVIATRHRFERPLVIRVYDVDDLLASSRRPREEALAELSGSIKEMWVDNGGRFGTLRYFGGKLIVGQTQENQRRVAELLASLRGPAAAKPKQP